MFHVVTLVSHDGRTKRTDQSNQDSQSCGYVLCRSVFRMSFGGAYGKTTSDYVNAAKDAIATMVEALQERRRIHASI